MTCFQLRLSLPQLTQCQFSNGLPCPTSVAMGVSPLHASLGTFPRLHSSGSLQVGVAEKILDVDNFLESKHLMDLSKERELNKKVQFDVIHHSLEHQNDHKERQRKRKKEHGNKGRVPWNKGIKHTAETRAIIKKKTLEALRDPQVRKKMSEHSRSHSHEVKAKISSSLRRLWGKRLKWKRSKEKFFMMWAESIAIAAKNGGIGQQEMDWDSYDKIKQEMTLCQLQCAAEKARMEELKQIERQIQPKAGKMQLKNEKREMRKKKAKARSEAKKKTRRKRSTTAEGFSLGQGHILKRRLRKILRQRPLNHMAVSGREERISHSTPWKKLDIELLKRENIKKEESLADQIQAAKSQRMQRRVMEALEKSSPVHSSVEY